tara:strand:+ start:393 stop:1268 length:876 start_codon:yes stop_codon:yes gene_type:complete
MKTLNKIHILGSIALDTIEINSQKEENLLGGSASYATISAGLFSNVSPIGIVGSDFPIEAKEILNKFSDGIENIEFKKGSTFRWGGRYHLNGDDRDTLFTELGVFEDYKPIVKNINHNAGYLYLANIHPSLQLQVLSQFKKPYVVMDTMNLWIDIARKNLEDIIRSSNILLINESELMLFSNSSNIQNSALKILEMGPEYVVVKLGSKGSICFGNNLESTIGVCNPKKIVDPTGAGDAFGGGLISALSQGSSIEEAIKRGTAIASFCIEEFGVNRLLNLNKIDVLERVSDL